MKRTVNAASKQMSKSSSNLPIRENFFQTLKTYNKLKKQKRKSYRESILNELNSTRNENPQKYWTLLEKLKTEDKPDNPTSTISTEEWKEYFESLNTKLSDIQTEESTRETETGEEQMISALLNKSVSESEIINALKKCHNNKAQGLDQIMYEMLKYSQHVLLPILTKLFNLVLKCAIYPEKWAEGYIIPLYKNGNPLLKDNYRGITITSCLGKLFNAVMNVRLSNFSRETGKETMYQIAYNKDSRTSDHIFVLKTLIDKYVRNGKSRLYCCFVDFQKAFDCLNHKKLFSKLSKYGVNGNFYTLIKDMYKKSKVCIKGKNGRSSFFKATVGVRQGDNLSPTLFKIFVNDLPGMVSNKGDSPILCNETVGSLLFADDLVLLSTTPDGLQQKLNLLSMYCSQWGLTLNGTKTKIMTFNVSGKLLERDFHYNNIKLECTRQYKYLGVYFQPSGLFTVNETEYYNKGLKALFKMQKLLQNSASFSTYLHLFNSIVKPVTLYASEIWAIKPPKSTGRESQNVLKSTYGKVKHEKLNLLMCRQFLGVHNKSCKTAIYGDTGVSPLYIDYVINATKYLNRLREGNCHPLLEDAYTCNKDMYDQGKDCWLKNVLNMLSFLEVEKLPNANTINIKKLKSKLQNDLDSIWKSEIESVDANSKLRTYKVFKTNRKAEKYLMMLNFKQRQILARFRISAHNLHVETGRHCNTPLELRLCMMCDEKKVEDEIHFLLECPLYNKEREILYDTVFSKYESMKALYPQELFPHLLSSEDTDVINALATFLTKSMQKRTLLKHAKKDVPTV